MKTNLMLKGLLLVVLFTVSNAANAQFKYENNKITFNTTPYYDSYKYYDVTLKGNLWLVCPVKPNQYFQIDTNPAATRLASHYDQVVFYNTQKSLFNSIQVKNVYNYSDARAKTNIQSLNNGLSAIKRLNPVQYDFIDKSDRTMFKVGGTGKEVGLLAQEVEAILPNLVLTDPEGNKLINYNGIIPVLIDAIKNSEPGSRNLEK